VLDPPAHQRPTGKIEADGPGDRDLGLQRAGTPAEITESAVRPPPTVVAVLSTTK
jgi:hypothetical protein